MNQLLLQIIYIVIILGVTIGFGVLPYKSNFLRKFVLIIGLLNAFSGGMFLSMGMVHILPEAVATYQKGKKSYNDTQKEHVHSSNCSHGKKEAPGAGHAHPQNNVTKEVKDKHDHKHHDHEHHEHKHEKDGNCNHQCQAQKTVPPVEEPKKTCEKGCKGHGHDNKPKKDNTNRMRQLDDKPKEKHPTNKTETEHKEDEPCEGHDNLIYLFAVLSFCIVLFFDKILFNNHDQAQKYEEAQHSSHRHSAPISEENYQTLVQTQQKLALRLSNQLVERRSCCSHDHHEQEQQVQVQKIRPSSHHSLCDEGDHHHHHHHHANIDNNVSIVQAILLIFAMGLHSIFEGFQMGLQEDDKDITNMFIIIIVHKWNEAYQMGQSLKRGGIKFNRAIFYIVFYSLLTPIGILVAQPIKILVDGRHKISGLLQVLSVGIFLYISIGEIILEEFVISKHKFPKFIAMIIGVLFVYLFIQYGPEHTHVIQLMIKYQIFLDCLNETQAATNLGFTL